MGKDKAKLDYDTINDNDARKCAAEILEVIEGILDMHDLTIPSTDRAIKDKVSGDEARIYGDVYYMLEDQLTQHIENLGNYAGFMKKFGDKMPPELKKAFEEWWILQRI